MSATYLSRAWSCTVRLVVEDGRAITAAAADLAALLDRVDRAASRFRADSALSQANAHAGRPIPVPRLLADLVDTALTAAAQTDGAVDPTVGAALVHAGYDRDIAAIAADGPAAAPRVATKDWRAVRLDRTAGLLVVPAGTALDLGATAKSHVADLAARTLARRYDTAVLVELGGDLAVAGERRDGWTIRVAEHEGGDGQVVCVRRGGLATSTTTVRRWQRGGQAVHHILDPRTGAPADGPWRTVSVYAPTALAANTASTAAIVLGETALPWLEEHDLAARLVGTDGSIRHTAGWPAVHETSGVAA